MATPTPIYLGPFMRLKDFSFGKLMVALVNVPCLNALKIMSTHVNGSISGESPNEDINIGVSLSNIRLVRTGPLLHDPVNLPYYGYECAELGRNNGGIATTFIPYFEPDLNPIIYPHYYPYGVITPDQALRLPISGYGPWFWEQWFDCCKDFNLGYFVINEFINYYIPLALSQSIPWMNVEPDEGLGLGWFSEIDRFRTEPAPEPIATIFYNWINWYRQTIVATPVGTVSLPGYLFSVIQPGDPEGWVSYLPHIIYPRQILWEIGIELGLGVLGEVERPDLYSQMIDLGVDSYTQRILLDYPIWHAWPHFAQHVEEYGQRVEVWSDSGKFLWKSPNAVEIDLPHLLSQLEETTYWELFHPLNALNSVLWGHLKTKSLEVYGYTQNPNQSELIGVYPPIEK